MPRKKCGAPYLVFLRIRGYSGNDSESGESGLASCSSASKPSPETPKSPSRPANPCARAPAHLVQKMHDPNPKICRTFKRLFENPPRNFRLAVDLRSHTKDGCVIADSSVVEVPAVLDLVPRPNHFRQPVFTKPVAAVQVRVKALHQGSVLLVNSRFFPIWVRIQNRQCASLIRRQPNASRLGGLALFRSLVAKYLERIVNFA